MVKFMVKSLLEWDVTSYSIPVTLIQAFFKKSDLATSTDRTDRNKIKHHLIIYNNNGNFICVFECTIVNLATYRQFTNAAWDWIIKKKKLKQKQNKSRKKKSKLHKVWAIPVPISTTKDVICCSNGHICHFLDYNSNIDNNKNPWMSRKKIFQRKKWLERGRRLS